MVNPNSPPPSKPTKQSHLGIASYIIAILTNLIVIGDVAIALRMQENPNAVQDFALIDPLLTWLTAILAMAGLGLGISAVLRKEKKKLLGRLGLIFNGLFLLGILSLYIINAITLMRGGGG
jgi:hypothetical protein